MYIPEIKAKRSWNVDAIQTLVAKKKFYNKSPERLSAMLEFVKSSEATYESIYRVACDIQWSSKRAIGIPEIMALLEGSVVETAFTVSNFNPFGEVV